MSRKVVTKEEQEVLEKPFDFETFELKTIEDYAVWNLHAHRAFREAKKSNPRCDPPIPVRVPATTDVKLAAVSDTSNANANVMGAIMGWFEAN